MYVVDHLKIGGAQTHLVQLLTHLDRRRFSPMVCALKAQGELCRTVEAMGVPVFDGGLGRTLMGPGGLRVLWRLARLLRRERVDVAHAYLFHPNVLTPVAARLAGVRAVVASKRSLDRYPGRGPRYACRLGNALAHRVMVNAAAIGRFVAAEEGCPPGKMVLIPNGVRQEALAPSADRGRAKRRELGLPEDAPVVGAVSRLAWKKGIRHLVDAAPRLLEAVPDARIVVAGAGPLRGELEAAATALGVADRVRFLGSRSDTIELMAALDVFVLPSVVEGMSNALIEAMAVGRPVVATDVGGNPEVLVDGETGFLVPPGDPLQLTAAIVKLLESPEMAVEMGAAGRRRVLEHYQVDTMARRIEALYDDLLGREAA
jgi:glycosyltransferase involved in cell wall biosynthesis